MVKTNQLLTFTLGTEVYALEVGSTREVVDFVDITPVPKTPEWIRGVLNLRGSVIPVLDLKFKLGMGRTERSRDACILILEMRLDRELSLVGVLADSVREVLDLSPSQIEPPPKFGASIKTTYIRAMGRQGNALFIILDVDRVFSSAEMELATQVGESAEALVETSGREPPEDVIEAAGGGSAAPVDRAPPMPTTPSGQ